ncbi:MAG TPA: metallophosphoesterase family protein [Candidatus Ozemobacteraceae bacterium]|nr:metallophosphoesterase family protein [Candidatus Ozemobacteraceae bacterium]
MSRTLILSDIHSNFDALTQVLRDCQSMPVDRTWVLGDICGYGPQPQECIGAIQALSHPCIVMGNHDRVIGKIEQPVGFNPHAISAAYRNMRQLDDSSIQWLAQLPARVEVDAHTVLCHGSPEDPDMYLLSLAAAVSSFHQLKNENRLLGFFGHTHVPAVFEWDQETNAFNDIEIEYGQPVTLDLSGRFRYLINPGSVGQPRDGNPMASYAILIQEHGRGEICFVRVGYSVVECQRKMSQLGYPEMLIKRLAVGF